MKCDDIFELILSGSPLAEEMQDHVGHCKECQSLCEAVRDLDAEGAKESERDLSSAAVANVLAEAARITDERISPPHTKMKEWWLVQRLAAAAAVILAVGLGIMGIRRLLLPDEPEGKPVTSVALVLEMEMDSLRDDVTAEIAGFGARHYSRADAGSFDHEMTVLNSRIAVASMGLERELAGL